MTDDFRRKTVASRKSYLNLKVDTMHRTVTLAVGVVALGVLSACQQDRTTMLSTITEVQFWRRDPSCIPGPNCPPVLVQRSGNSITLETFTELTRLTVTVLTESPAEAVGRTTQVEFHEDISIRAENAGGTLMTTLWSSVVRGATTSTKSRVFFIQAGPRQGNVRVVLRETGDQDFEAERIYNVTIVDSASSVGADR